jgi:hypothetical protein
VPGRHAGRDHRSDVIAGAAEYLTKPLDVPRFLEVVDALLAVASRPR